MSTLRELEAAVSAKRAELIEGPYPHGPCECVDGCQCARRAGPAAFEVVRDGKTVKVCTRCDLSTDKATLKLLVTAADDLEVYQAWDDLGALCIGWKIKEAATQPKSPSQGDGNG